MSDIYSIASVGLFDGQKRLETISQNAASASLPGYRRSVSAPRSFAADLAQLEAAASNVPAAAAGKRVDLRAGPLAMTGRALDVAIEGDDLFFGLTDGVKVWLTRAGGFQLNPDGVLVGERGLRVQGVSGDIKLDSPDVEVRPDGQILRDGVVVGALQLFKPTQRASIEAVGGTLISAAEGIDPAAPGTIRLRANTLEGSNSGTASEMVDLLTLTRQFESLVRVTQGYDELLGRTIQKLGEV